MGYISCYDYTAESTGEYRVGLINSNDLQALESHSFTYDGVTYTATKNLQDSSRRINIHIEEIGTRVENSAEQFSNVLNAAGIRVSDLFLGSYINWMDAGTKTYGFVNDYTSAPKFTLYWTGTQLDNTQTVTVYPPTGTSLAINANGHSPATPGYTTGRLLLEFAPTIADMSNGLFVVVKTEWSTHQNIQNSNYLMIDIFYWPAFLTGNNYESEAGEPGFKPTGAYTSNNFPGQGGRPTGSPHKKEPDYASDTVTQPGAPDESAASVVRSGFLNVYKMSEAELNKICGALYSDTLLNAIKNMFVNPLDFIISLMIFPCAPSVSSTPTNIKFGKWDAALTGATALGVDITGNKLSLGFGHYDFGSVSIPENWGNFLDYSQTNIELYLPFIGSVNIDVSECMGGSISVEYTIDFFTGMCVANVLCTKSVTLPSGKQLGSRPAQHSFQGNCAIQIPLSAESYGSMVGSLINACTQGISNPVAGFTGIAQDAVAGGMRPNVTSKGNIVANAGFCSVLYPYVRLTRPITAEPESYQEVMGLPSYINTSLGECTGLCICDGINLQSVSGATDNELNKIKQLCAEGVYV